MRQGAKEVVILKMKGEQIIKKELMLLEIAIIATLF